MADIKLPFKQEWWDINNFEPLIHDQAFGFEVDDRLCTVPDSHPPRYSTEKFLEHESVISAMDTGFSEVFHTDDGFEIHLKVKPFKMENITVTSVEDSVKVLCEHQFVVEGKGEVRRRLKRIYVLPKSCDPFTLKAYVRSDDVLVLNCKKGDRNRERVIPLGFGVC